MNNTTAAQRLRALRVDARTAAAWQQIPRYIRDELEQIEGDLMREASNDSTIPALIQNGRRLLRELGH